MLHFLIIISSTPLFAGVAALALIWWRTRRTNFLAAAPWILSSLALGVAGMAVLEARLGRVEEAAAGGLVTMQQVINYRLGVTFCQWLALGLIVLMIAANAGFLAGRLGVPGRAIRLASAVHRSHWLLGALLILCSLARLGLSFHLLRILIPPFITGFR